MFICSEEFILIGILDKNNLHEFSKNDSPCLKLHIDKSSQVSVNFVIKLYSVENSLKSSN